MGKSAIPFPSADNISDSEFQEYLGRYPACLEAISISKGAKPGQKTLLELDQYRYGKALSDFDNGEAESSMSLEDIKVLVDWKLRHGQYRPTLMKLVAANEPVTVKDTIREAVHLYREKADVSGALGILTRLKGIGPATASLLLAVHDAENVIFFADEAFYWLCAGGSKVPIKYNASEYADLNEKANALAKRLGVKAVDVERVAYVLLKSDPASFPRSAGAVSEESAPSSERKKRTRPEREPAKRRPVKRKTQVESDAEMDGEYSEPAPPRRRASAGIRKKTPVTSRHSGGSRRRACVRCHDSKRSCAPTHRCERCTEMDLTCSLEEAEAVAAWMATGTHGTCTDCQAQRKRCVVDARCQRCARVGHDCSLDPRTRAAEAEEEDEDEDEE